MWRVYGVCVTERRGREREEGGGERERKEGERVRACVRGKRRSHLNTLSTPQHRLMGGLIKMTERQQWGEGILVKRSSHFVAYIHTSHTHTNSQGS